MSGWLMASAALYQIPTMRTTPVKLFNPCTRAANPSNGIKVISNRFQPPSTISKTPYTPEVKRINSSSRTAAKNNRSLRRLDSFAIGPKHPESHKFDIPRLTRSLSTHCSFRLFGTLHQSRSRANTRSLVLKRHMRFFSSKIPLMFP